MDVWEGVGGSEEGGELGLGELLGGAEGGEGADCKGGGGFVCCWRHWGEMI